MDFEERSPLEMHSVPNKTSLINSHFEEGDTSKDKQLKNGEEFEFVNTNTIFASTGQSISKDVFNSDYPEPEIKYSLVQNNRNSLVKMQDNCLRSTNYKTVSSYSSTKRNALFWLRWESI